MIRLKNIFIVVSFLFCIIVLRLWQLQIKEGEHYYNLSENNRIRLIPVSPVRGRILDRNGVVLAQDRPSFELGIIETGLTKKQKKEVLEILAGLLDVPYEKLEANRADNFALPFVPKVILRDITRQQAIAVEIQKWKLPGVIIQAVPIRSYPFDEAGCHVLGSLGLINREELRQLRPYGFQPKDVIGRSGVEKMFDETLRGKPGGRQLEVDHHGRIIRVLSRREQVQGRDVQLSIDIGLQQKAEELIRDRSGVIIIMDPYSGQVLALASQPGYNPNVFVDFKLSLERGKLIDPDNRDKPLVNRALSGGYAPGSIFKIVIAAGGLEDKKINLGTVFSCPGYKRIGRRRFRCWRGGGHGADIDIKTALAGSCNVFFYSAGLLLGPDEIARFARIFGLGQKSGLGLAGEKKGLIPDKRWKRTVLKQGWYGGETANYAIGQGFMTITPIQAMGMINVIANKGNLVNPTLTKGSRPVRERVDISAKTLNIIRQGLYETVHSEYGTAYFARMKDMPFSGKTGTAQAPGNKKHGWFVGYAPSEKPKISLTVFLEDSTGGHEAAEIAEEMLGFWKEMEK